MTDITSEAEVIRLYHKMFREWLEDYDLEAQQRYGIGPSFDIRSYTPEEVAAAGANHKEGEAVPCDLCIVEALQQARGELEMEAQAQQQMAPQGTM